MGYWTIPLLKWLKAIGNEWLCIQMVIIFILVSWIELGLKRLLVEGSCWSLWSAAAAVSLVPLTRNRFGRSGLSTYGVDNRL